ncbi:WYL domain-containing protein [Actinomadura sp. BRA 177]|uniref:WYL domain-containing protein n=1 Tax=Actinomadura sp. BRA 177 TaxID=2745202 RepID=UPI00281669DF|nr:WYL domain-containing protein [Actinomadura sp. BRA 177]
MDKEQAQGPRRWARDVRPAEGGDGDWDEATLTFRDADRFAPYLARFADDVVVLDPPDLREAVIQHLKSVLAGTGAPPVEAGEARGPARRRRRHRPTGGGGCGRPGRCGCGRGTPRPSR